MKRQILLGLSALMIVGAAFAEVSSGEGDGKAAACAQAKKKFALKCNGYKQLLL